MKRKQSILFTQIEKKMAKYTLWTALFLFFLVLTNFVTHLFDTHLMIELASSALTILVCAFCLLHIYEDHEILYRKEKQLKQNLIKKIYQNYRHLPQKWVILNALEKRLETRSNPLQRLHLLRRFEQHSKELEAFIQRVSQRHAEEQLFNDLGLSWETHFKKTSRHHRQN